MYCESPERERVKLDPEELERKTKALSIANCGDESEWKLHLLAEVAIAMEDPKVAVSLKPIPTDGQSGPGPSTRNEIREASEPEAIADPEHEGDERTTMGTTGLGSDGHRDLEPPVKSSSLKPEAEDHHSKKWDNTLGSPESVPKSQSVGPGSRKRPRSEVSAEETENGDENEEDGENRNDEGGTDSEDDDTEGVESSAHAPPPPAGTAGGNNQSLPHVKTIAAHDKGASILGPGVGTHPRGRCVKCVKGKHTCFVNPNVGNGNTCYRCAKNKEKCSHQEYVDGQWIRENGKPATRQCTQCSVNASCGLPAECYQADKDHKDKYGKACSQCHMDGTKNACSLKEPPKKRPKGQAPKKQKK